jgi:hypothetical protein
VLRHHAVEQGVVQVGIHHEQIAQTGHDFRIGHDALGDRVAGGTDFLGKPQLSDRPPRILLLPRQTVSQAEPEYGHHEAWKPETERSSCGKPRHETPRLKRQAKTRTGCMRAPPDGESPGIRIAFFRWLL